VVVQSPSQRFFLIQNEKKLIPEVLFFRRAFISHQMPVNSISKIKNHGKN